MSTAMASTMKAVAKGQEGKQSLEATVHRLKLDWIMASDEAEKRKISEEIRRVQSSGTTKRP